MRRRPSWATLLLAVVAYVPLLFTSPGTVGADTKAYLYLDPGTMLRRAMSMWDPHVGTGGVTHQNIGYLLPQGLFYWLFHLTGLPIWFTQRLWTGSVLFAAGAGVLYLVRSFDWPDRFAVIAAMGYMLSPYLLEYEARMSAILLPWAGLAWMVGIAVRGLRSATAGRAGWRLAGWRYPAAFAITVTLVGSINASSLIFVLLAPLLWLPFGIWGTREASARAAGAMIVRTSIAVLLANVWWMSGLLSQARYGLDVLAYTETIKTVASSSQASEVLRGLGNWYFYGRDAVGPWIGPANNYTQALLTVAISFSVPILALVAASAIRWTHRAYFVTLVLVGTALAVGVYPFSDPSPFGAVLKAFGTGSTVGLALRSTPRAVPLVALGLSVLLAGGVAALAGAMAPALARRPASRLRWVPIGAGIGVLGLIALNMMPLWQGRFVDPGLNRPEKLPAYETAFGKALTAEGTATRTLELPGADFSHYRWGTTLDPVTTGLTDRSVISRQLVPDGEAAAADLVRALDRRLQEGVFETSSLADISRLLGVGDVELRSDLQYERYRTPRPKSTFQLFTQPVPAGLTAPRTFGPAIAETPDIPYTDEITLAEPANAANPPAIALFGVTDPTPIVRAETTSEPLLVSGNGEGLVDAAAAGLLAAPVADGRTVLYTASMAKDPAALRAALSDGADLLLTDSNRLRAERWSSVRENYGYVQQPGVKPLATDPNDQPLPVFPDENTGAQTVAELSGPDSTTAIASVGATDYGNTVTYAPADQALNAVDGDPTTAWRTGAFTNPVGTRWQVTMKAPVTAGQVTLVQPVTGSRNRWITKATMRFDGGSPVTVALDDSSRTDAGQVVRFPSRSFTKLDIQIDATSAGARRDYAGLSAVGLAEVTIGAPGTAGMQTDEILRLPTDLLDAAGASSQRHQLIIQIARDRANPAEPFKADTEASMAREFTLPTARTFALTGTARISALVGDPTLDAADGRSLTGIRATSSGRLPGDLGARAASAFDGDPSTFWSPGTQNQVGNWLQVTSPKPVTFSSMTLSIVADGRHSVPTKLGLVVDGTKIRDVAVPPITDTTTTNGTRTVRLSFPSVTGSTVRLVVDGVRATTTIDSISSLPIDLPVAIAEAGIAGLRVPAEPATVPSTCRTNLLTVDGKPVGVRLSGTTAVADARGGLGVSLCGAPLTLAKGVHVVRTAAGAKVGIDLDRLVLGSDAGGGASPVRAGTIVDTASPAVAATTPAAPTPKVSIVSSGETSYKLRVSGATPGRPFWLVLGQSLSKGWSATTDAGGLGAPRLVDGYANGWRVTPSSSTFTVSLDWTPQRIVWGALATSAVAIPLCLLVLFLTRPRGARRPRAANLPVFEPLRTTSAGVGWRPSVAVAVGVGILGAAVVSPVAGVVTAAVALGAMRVPRLRLVARVGSVLCLVVSALYVLEIQARYKLPTSGDWVSNQHKVAAISWMAVILLVTDVVVAGTLRRRTAGPGPSGPATPDPATPDPAGP